MNVKLFIYLFTMLNQVNQLLLKFLTMTKPISSNLFCDCKEYWCINKSHQISHLFLGAGSFPQLIHYIASNHIERNYALNPKPCVCVQRSV